MQRIGHNSHYASFSARPLSSKETTEIVNRATKNYIRSIGGKLPEEIDGKEITSAELTDALRVAVRNNIERRLEQFRQKTASK